MFCLHQILFVKILLIYNYNTYNCILNWEINVMISLLDISLILGVLRHIF